MRRSLLNNLNLPKCLRQALVLFTLLLLPSAAWGQITVVDVGLSVSGTVTREGIITGTVTYDAYNNILTLEDADITYEGSIIIAESSNKLTIDIKGNNTIKTTSSDPVITRTGDASPEIEFTSSTNTGSLILEYAGGDSNQRLLELITPSGLAPKFLAPETANDWSSATKAEIKALGLTVAGVTATTGNCTDILTGDNKGKVSFTPAEGSDPATLTLAGVNIGPSSAGIVWSGFYPLKIKYSGNNIINTRTESVVNEEDGYCIFYNGSNTGSPVLSLSASDDASTLVLKPSNGESNSRAAITRFSVNCNGWGMYYSDDCSQVTSATNPTPGKEVIISKEPPLGLSVAGVPVTSANKDDVLKDGGKVKFTPADGTASPATPATLTLNGATISGNIQSSISPLTVHLIGSSIITPSNDNDAPFQYTYEDNTPYLIFESSEEDNGEITLNGVISTGGSETDRTITTGGYNAYYIDYNNNHSSFQDRYASTTTYKYWIFDNKRVFYNPHYGISVNNYEVTKLNKDGVTSLGSGDITYLPNDNLLCVPNNPSLYFNVIKSHRAELNIQISGDCTLKAIRFEAKSSEFGTPETKTLNISRTSTSTSGINSLTIDTGTDSSEPAISGFDAVNLDEEFHYDIPETEPTGYETKVVISDEIAFDLWVEGQRVTSRNKDNVKGETSTDPDNPITPSVVFDNDHNILTLTKANIIVSGNDAIVSGLDNLTVHLVHVDEDDPGVQNVITCQGENDCAFKGTKSGAKVTFTTDVSLPDGLSCTVIKESNLFKDIEPVYQEGLSCIREGDPYFIKSTKYDLIIGGIDVTSLNQKNVFADDDVNDGKISFTPAASDSDPAVLTLNGVILSGDKANIVSKIPNLEIHLVGDNVFTYNETFIIYQVDDTDPNGQLTFTTEATTKDDITTYGSLTVNGISSTNELVSKYDITNETSQDGDDGWAIEEASDQTSSYVSIAYLEYYELWIGGNQFHSRNLSLPSGGTKYTPKTHTLHLEDISSYSSSSDIKSGLEELIVEVKGDQNSFSGFTYVGTTSGKLIIKKDDTSNVTNSITLNNTAGVITGFGTVTITLPMHISFTYPQDFTDWTTSVTKATITDEPDDDMVSDALSDIDYATFYSEDRDLYLSSSLTPYVITDVSGNNVVTQALSYIPKKTPVLIGKVQNTATTAVTTGNKLNYVGEDEDVKASETKVLYVLFEGKFVKVTKNTSITQGKCYLDLSASTNAGTRGFYNILGEDDGSTGISEVKSEGVNSEKWNGEWFDLQGLRLPAQPTKPGLYLHNGHKVVIK